MTIGAKIKELRLEHELSQAELGALVGVSQKAVAFWENNANEPKVGYMIALARKLGISYDELFEDVD